MDVIVAGALQWPLLTPPCGDDGPDTVSPDQWATAQAVAVEWLWAQSGRQFGTWDVVFRPEWTIPVARGPRNYVLGEGDWRRASPITVTDRPLHSAPLPGPVQSVTAVEVDGVVLPSTAWEINGNDLIRVDGQSWYRYQDTTQPATAVGTWQITYVRGCPPPSAGQYAAAVLACDEAKRMGSNSCRLPGNTTQVTRTGVTVSLDATQLQMGYTGLREVDQWLRTVNPNNVQSAPTVWSPDLDPAMLPPIPTSTY